MFQPGLVLPLDSIDKRRKNENIQSSRSSDQPPPSNQDIPTGQFDERRWFKSAAKQLRQNSEIQAAGEEVAVGVSSSKQDENSVPAASLENSRKISQIDADNSGRETGAKHHRAQSEKWRSELSSGPARPGDGEDAWERTECIDKKNCVYPLTSSASAKTSHSAKSELEGSEALPSSPGGRHVDPPENERRSENRNNNTKSSSGERKRLKVIWILFKHFNLICGNLSEHKPFFT